MNHQTAIAIIEADFLIAEDAAHILSCALSADTRVLPVNVRDWALDLSGFDLAVVDVDALEAGVLEGLALAGPAGLAVLFTSAWRQASRNLPAGNPWPVLAKPFSEEALADAARRALEMVRQNYPANARVVTGAESASGP